MIARMDKARSISDVLAGLDDEDVRRLVDAAEPVGVGIGGTTKVARIGETNVFVKQLPLPSLEEADRKRRKWKLNGQPVTCGPVSFQFRF